MKTYLNTTISMAIYLKKKKKTCSLFLELGVGRVAACEYCDVVEGIRTEIEWKYNNIRRRPSQEWVGVGLC